MGKFGIGARVVDLEGDVAEVIGKRKGYREVRYSGGKYDGVVAEWPKSSLEPANDNSARLDISENAYSDGEPEAVSAWVPKVGDRVRPISDKLGWVTSHWDAYWKAKEGYSENDTFVVVQVGSGDAKISAKAGGDGPWWSFDTFEIIAPVTPAAPPAKFKVGDRVVALKSSYSSDYVAGRTYEVSEYTKTGDYGHIKTVRDSFGNEDNGWGADNFELAPALPIGSQVTFTATGRLSAYTKDGHAQVTFPDLTPGQNSFALPAKFVAAA